MTIYPRIFSALLAGLCLVVTASGQQSEPSADKGIGQAAAATTAPSVAAATPIAGTGTTNKLAKWLDGAGTVGDSSILETNGLTVFGRSTPLLLNAANFHLVEMVASGTKTPLVLVGGSGSMEFWKDTAGAGGGPTAGMSVGMAVPGTAATNDIIFSTISSSGWGERLRITQTGDVKLSGAGKGIIFPDGTKQTTAATAGVSSVAHDTSLAGSGTAASPLAIAAGGVGTNALAAGAVDTNKIKDGAVSLSKIGTANSATGGQVLTFDGANMVWSTPSAQSGGGGGGGAPYVWVCAPVYMVPNSGGNSRTDLFVFNGGTTTANVAAHILDKDGNNLAGVTIPGTSPNEYYPGETGTSTVPVAPGSTRMVKWNGPQMYLGLTDASISVRVTSDQPIVVSATLQWSPMLTIPCSPLPK